MRVIIATDILADEYDGQPTKTPAFLTGYIAGAEPYIVPGVVSWDNVTAEMLGDDKAKITADLTTELVVADNDPSGNAGQIVTEDWVRDYILGADAYWLAPDVAKATEVTFA